MTETKVEPYTIILDNKCATCKYCCHEGVPEGICAYNTIQEILKNQIPDEIIKKLVIYRVPENKIEAAAHIWDHFPFKKNLLRLMTTPIDGIYEFLAVPYANENCIFLSPSGCVYPSAKPFDCTQFPFYYRNGVFTKIGWCPITITLNEKEIRKKAQKAVQEYEQFLIQHQAQYSQDLIRLKQQYHFQELEFNA
jgi:Fe-S-cluster containining protein